jgi:hypothetical protein
VASCVNFKRSLQLVIVRLVHVPTRDEMRDIHNITFHEYMRLMNPRSWSVGIGHSTCNI